ncbi:hypothetical protein SDC9_73033 [bioreactor metagenome]|uniref:Uncharacterized protein n=1 Tax=bioreactor metagenome TaxID=1076179 RepID=A0A644YE12_9ZZZZ
MVAEIIPSGIGTALNVQIQRLHFGGKQQMVKANPGKGHRSVVETVVVRVEHLRIIPRRLKRRHNGVQQTVIPGIPETDVGTGLQVLPRQA